MMSRMCEREGECVCVHVYECVFVCVYECMCERERERVYVNVCARVQEYVSE